MRFEDIEEATFVALSTSVLLALSAIDLDVRRIPNVIVVPGVICALAWVTGSFAARRDLHGLFEAVIVSVVAFSLLLLIAVISGGMGFGDVKLAAFVGLVTGRFGWEVTFVAILGAFLIGGVVALVLLATKQVGRKDAISFGPSLALAATIALFGGPALASSWLSLF